MFSDDPLIRDASPTAIAFVVGAYLLLLTAGIVVALILAFKLSHRDAPWADRSRELIGRSLSWLDGGRIAVAVLSLVVLSILLVLALRGRSEGTLLVLQSLTLDLAGLACVGLVLRRSGLSWRAVFGMRWRGPSRSPNPNADEALTVTASEVPPPFGSAIGRGALAYAALIPFIVFASLVSEGILTAQGYPPSIQDIARELTAAHPPWLQAYLLILAVGLAPLFEETVFRGVLLPLFARRFGLGVSVLLTSAIFAGIHANLYATAPLFVVAVGCSLAYVYTGSLWVPVTMHALFNGINLLFLLVLKGTWNQ